MLINSGEFECRAGIVTRSCRKESSCGRFRPGRVGVLRRRFRTASMSNRPASITQADIARAIRAAKREGASEVEVRINDKASVIVRFQPAPESEIRPEQRGGIVL